MIFGKILGLFAEIYIWKAILYTDQSFQEMCTYIFVKTFLMALTKNKIIMDMNQKVRTGQISMDISRPLSFPIQLITEAVGYCCFQVVFMAFPVMLIELCFFEIVIPKCQWLLCFIIFTLGAMSLKIMFCICMATFSFWVNEIGILNRLLEDVTSLFSGSLVPLWLFPGKLSALAEILPFRFIIYVPVTIFMGKYTEQEIWVLFLFLLLFLFIFGSLAIWLWKRSLKNVLVNGG